MHPEVGGAIKARDMEKGQIVVIAPPGRNVLMTMRVMSRVDDMVIFRGELPGGQSWVVVNRIRDDGACVDDQGRVVELYAYLGDD